MSVSGTPNPIRPGSKQETNAPAHAGIPPAAGEDIGAAGELETEIDEQGVSPRRALRILGAVRVYASVSSSTQRLLRARGRRDGL